MAMLATADVAKAIGTSRNTLLRWIREGLLADVQRDWRGWRIWSPEDLARAKDFREAYHAGIGAARRQRRQAEGRPRPEPVSSMLVQFETWARKARWSA
jgi:DNA-binding transcriptional MerR regulator